MRHHQTNNGDVMVTPAFKYGPSAVRDVHYVTGAKVPYVTVKQRRNGQYVVVERLPVHHRQRDQGLPTLQQSLAESAVTLRSIKPMWMPSSKARSMERQYDDAGHLLPDIDLGWRDKAKALVGSLDNVHHAPGGGTKTIESRHLKWTAQAKVGSLNNLHYKSPALSSSQTTRSDPHPFAQEPKFRPTPRYGALASTGALNSTHYTPGGAQVVIAATRTRQFSHVASRVGSLDNAGHVPGGGDIKIPHHRHRWKAEARLGSLENINHVPAVERSTSRTSGSPGRPNRACAHLRTCSIIPRRAMVLWPSPATRRIGTRPRASGR
ncbi:hypothetical protein C0Q70_02608 [Pomacea canaliculata]|uniref:Microtubule-associated protein n=1 Tax=Pomacea canaliculata TaxID=400727 RepID=A0A2T7PQF4_POMCA|nr:microtubule-associated protein tau-like [Pomacea canaliculata]PVD35645.1 hypothetical protein C0Q70_02608 [Pomacea canaliculata]